MTVPFEEFVVAHTAAMLRLAGSLTGDRASAEDIVQDVFIKAADGWPRIGQLSSPEAYVRRMVVNQFMSWHRRHARTIPRAEVAVESVVADPADRYAERSEMVGRLDRLPVRQRAVLVLRYYADLDDASIADILGCSPATVRSHASRGLATLRIDQAQSRSMCFGEA